MSLRESDHLWTNTEDGRHIVSKCGLYCDTCPAFIHGLCQGCPKLSLDDCVVKACAHRKEIDTCHDCERDSCYHFEAYYERRQMIRRRTKRLMTRKKVFDYERGVIAAKSGCGSGGGCGGCSSAGACGPAATATTNGCSAVNNIVERINNIASQAE